MFISLALLASCASSNNEQINLDSVEHLVQLKSPGDEPSKTSRVYIDSVKLVTADDRLGLLIGGTFPDACTNLKNVTHHVRNDSLHMNFETWRNPNVMCAQVLTPFTYFYDKISDDELSSYSAVIINGSSYSF